MDFDMHFSVIQSCVQYKMYVNIMIIYIIFISFYDLYSYFLLIYSYLTRRGYDQRHKHQLINLRRGKRQQVQTNKQEIKQVLVHQQTKLLDLKY